MPCLRHYLKWVSGWPDLVRDSSKIIHSVHRLIFLSGEFSQRAFRNGKMDISSVEGLSDLINSETQLQRRQALWQMAGGAEEQYNKWVAELTRALATIEALIDFGDDEQIEAEVCNNSSIPNM